MSSAFVNSLLLARDDMPFIPTLSCSASFFSSLEYLNSSSTYSSTSSSSSTSTITSSSQTQEKEEFNHIKNICDITICEKPAVITLLKTTKFDAVISIQDPRSHAEKKRESWKKKLEKHCSDSLCLYFWDSQENELPHSGPTFQIIVKIFQYATTLKGKKVLIHCKIGKSRSPAAASIVLQTLGIGLESSLKHVKKIRSIAQPNAYMLKLYTNFMEKSKIQNYLYLLKNNNNNDDNNDDDNNVNLDTIVNVNINNDVEKEQTKLKTTDLEQLSEEIRVKEDENKKHFEKDNKDGDYKTVRNSVIISDQNVINVNIELQKFIDEFEAELAREKLFDPKTIMKIIKK